MAEVEKLDLGPFGSVAAGTNVGQKGIADGAVGTGGWVVAGGILYSPSQKAEMVAAEFGWAAAFLDHKELKPILLQAAESGWTMQKLETELRKTDCWKNTTDAQRKWDSEVALDPATAAEKIADAAQAMQTLASQIGGVLDPDALDTLAKRALRNGWTDTDTTNAVTRELLRDGQRTDIRGGLIGREIQSTAADMAVPIGDKAVDRWIKQIAAGKATLEDFQNYARNQAKGMYGALADDIDRGLTVKDLADPYAAVAERVLGVTGEQFDLTKGKWNVALNSTGPDGKRRTMTLQEWEDHLRKDQRYGYLETEEATNKAYALADTIAQMFGKV